DQRLGQILAKDRSPTREIIYHADPRALAQPYPAPGYAPAPASFAPAQSGGQSGSQSGTPANSWASSIEQAVAEISARQHNLDCAPVPSPAYTPNSTSPYIPPAVSAPLQPMPAPAYAAPAAASGPRFPAQDLSGLESQLRNITDQIERLHQPKDNEEIAVLRRELAEIGSKLNEAMPQRAIEALEHEMRKIAERIDGSRKFGVE